MYGKQKKISNFKCVSERLFIFGKSKHNNYEYVIKQNSLGK